MAAPFELIYYVGVPGRGEHVRLILEEAGADYTDTQTLPKDQVREVVASTLGGDDKNPPYFAPPLLRHDGLLISQTSNIIMYIGSKLGLAGPTPSDAWRVNAFALTALDHLSNEVHDSHHPIATELNWEDQKDESARRSKEWITRRLPKVLGYWQRVLSSESNGNGPWLLGKEFTYADLVLFQCIDGTIHSFPKAMNHAKESGKYDRVFKLYEDVKARPKIAAYLASDRRQNYAPWGLYRYYAENDVLPTL